MFEEGCQARARQVYRCLGLIDRQQSVKIGDTVSSIGYPNEGVPQGTLSGPKNFLVQINNLHTPCPIFKYVDDSTIFDVCNKSSVPMLQESADIITDWFRNNDMRMLQKLNKWLYIVIVTTIMLHLFRVLF